PVIFALSLHDALPIFWNCKKEAYSFDEPLANALVEFFNKDRDCLQLELRRLRVRTRVTILDVGCGSGQYVNALRKEDFDATGYEDRKSTRLNSSHDQI